MNGRIYDPKLGRMLQADPLVQAPKNSQNLNRYSYVLNNPLSYTDPTGYSFWKKVRPYVAIGVMVTGMIVAPQLAPLWGGLSGLINSGTIKGATIGAFSASMFYGIGQAFQHANTAAQGWLQAGKVLAHGVAGGVTSVLSGGKFGHGFWAAGITQAFAGQIDGIDSANQGFSPARVVAAAAVGGTASKISGGKFANGALTGAFSRAFNDEFGHQLTKAKVLSIGITGAGGPNNGNNAVFEKYVKGVGGKLMSYGDAQKAISKASDDTLIDLYGYSRGGNAVIRLTNWAGKKGVQIRNLETFDPYRRAGNFTLKYDNVRSASNYYQRNPTTGGGGILPIGLNPYQGRAVNSEFIKIGGVDFTGNPDVLHASIVSYVTDH